MSTTNEEIAQLYQSGLSMTQIAERLGVSYPTARARLLKAGVTPRSTGKAGRRPEKDIFNEAQTSEVAELLKSKVNMAEIARRMGVTPPTIHRYAKRLGLHTPRKDIQSHGGEILKQFIAGVHVDAIAKEYDTTRATIYTVIDRMGVNLIDIMVQERMKTRPSPEEQCKLRYAREKTKMETDPAFLAYMREKQARARQYRDERYAPALSAFFSRGCCKCGETREDALDAHHRDPSQKKFVIGHRNWLRVTVEELEDELAKCDCICAYCHRVLHTEQGDMLSHGGTSKVTLQVEAHRPRVEAIFAEFKKSGCQVCARKSIHGLSAHHFDPSTKLFNPSRALRMRMKTPLLVSELAKCTCLCESCHRLVHAEVLECPPPRPFSFTE